MGDQSVPASWIPSGWTALVFGAIALLFGGMSAKEAGLGVVLLQLPMILGILVCSAASVLAVVLMWAGRPAVSVTRQIILGAALALEWLVLAAFGAFGPSAGFSYGRSGKLLALVGLAMALLITLTIAVCMSRAARPSARR